jgi:GT2 family glycosyltransferase
VSRSVVVVSLRAGDWLEPCLESVRDQADQLVVVDNGSAGSEVSEVGRRFGALVVRNRDNQGFAGGANQGIRQATGEVVALLNDDAVAEATWLDATEPALGDPSVAAVTPKVLLDGWYGQLPAADEVWYAPGDTRPLGRQLTSVRHGGDELIDRLVGPGVHRLESGVVDGVPTRWRWTRPDKPYFAPLPGPDPEATVMLNGTDEVHLTAVCRLINNTGLFLRSDGYSGDHGLECPDDGRWDQPRETFGASGTALVTRADVLHRVGLLAEPFFAYYEDTDWSWRARRHGLAVTYLPTTSVSHRRSVTSVETLGDRVRILGERNRLLCLVRNAPSGELARQVWMRVADGPDHGVRRGMLTHLPWALATRAQLSRGSTVGVTELWDRWAGADASWDDGPAGAVEATGG